MLQTPVGRLRLAGLVEGTSFLVLLGIAMPLKYLAHIPEAVTVAGSVHGLLFVLYLLALANAAIDRRWPATWVLGGLVAGVVPFGTFVLEARLRGMREERLSADA